MDKNPTSTILIIDDEQAMREAMLELLADEGHHIVTAEDGAKGLAKAIELVPDLILLDLMMPEMNGFEVCQRLRANPLLAEVPIIMVTSLTDRDSRLRGFEAGADDFVSKPFDELELLTRVRSIIRLNRYRRLLQAQEALQESEERHRTLFDGVPVGLYRSTPDGQMLDANPALVEMLGYPDRESFLAINAIDGYADPAERQRWQALVEREGTVQGFEIQWQRQDGTPIWVRESTRAVYGADGQVLYYEGAAEDITERKQAQEALQRERDRAQRYLDIVEVILVAIDERGEITLINRRGCSTLERKEAELLGKNWFDTCLPAHMRQDVKTVFDRLMAGEIAPVEYYENPVVTQSGEERLIAWHNTVLRDEAGDIVGTLSSGEDVTDQRRAQEAYRALVDHSLQGLAIIQDGRILFANQALAEIGSYTVEELRTLSPTETGETIHPEDREMVFDHYQDQLEGRRGPERFAFRAVRKDGTIRWLEGYASRIEYQGRPAVQAAYVDITERIRSEKERAQAEEALRDSEEKYRNVVEHAHEAIVVVQDEMLKFFNPGIVKLAGYSYEELASITLIELLHPDDREAEIERQQKRLAGKSLPPIETLRIVDKQGNTKWVENDSIVITWEGKPATLHFVNDITERVQAEEALRESEKNYRSVVDNANVGIVVIEGGKRVFHNSRVPEILGYPEEEYQQVDFVTTIHPDDRALAIDRIRKRVSGEEIGSAGGPEGGPEGIEMRLITKSGETRWVQANSSAIHWKGKPAIQAFIADITERRKAEEALRASEEKFRSVVEQASDGIMLTDEQGHVVEWNQAQERMTGLNRAEVLGQPIWDVQFQVVPEEQRTQAAHERLKAGQIEMFATGRAPWLGQLLEHAIQRPDGTRLTIQTVAFPVQTERGMIVGSVSRDITEQKQAEEARHIQHNLGTALAATSDLTEALRQVLGATLQIERVDCGGVYRVDRSTGQLDLIVHQGLSSQFIERTSHYAPDAPQTRLIMAGEPIYQRYDKVSLGKRDPVRQSEGLRALAVIPIQYEGQVVAVLNLASHTHDEISAGTRNALEAIAAQIGSVIARIEAEEALQESEEKHRTLFETMTQGVLYWDAEGQVVSANPAAERILGLTLAQIRGKAPIDPGWKMARQDGSAVPDETLLAIAALRPREEMRNVTVGFFNPVLKGHRWVNVNAVPLLGPGESEPYRVHSIFEDITERVQAEAEIKQRNLELAALNEIGQAITSTLDLQETLTTIAAHTTRLMSMAATSVVLYDQASDDLYFAAASGEGADHVVGRRLALGRGIAGWVVQHGEPALVPDVSQDPRWFQGLDTGSDFVTHSILCVPLRSKGRTIGALEAINKEYGFSQDDLNLLNALTAQVATAIDNAQLFEEVRAGREQLQALSRRLVEVQEAERAHIARELHDETGQALSSLLLSLSLLEQRKDCPPEVKERVVQMEALIDEMLENLHRLSMNLRPAALDHLGLAVALEQYVETFDEQHAVDAQFEAVGLEGERLPPEMETALYRIVQEALTNVLRHSQATRVDVLVERRGNLVVTIVEDDGVGFDPESTRESGRLGLFGMRERAEMLGGTLLIESAAGAGATVFVEVPYLLNQD